MYTMSLKFSIPRGSTAKPEANRQYEVLVRDLSSYSMQNLSKLLKAALDETDNTALSYCIIKNKQHRT